MDEILNLIESVSEGFPSYFQSFPVCSKLILFAPMIFYRVYAWHSVMDF